MDINTSIALKLRTLREEKNLSQQYMADNMDIAKNSYSQIELGKTKITLDSLYKIAKLLETPVDKILGFNSSVNNTNSGFTIIQNNTGTLYFQPSEDQIKKLMNEQKKM
jgi:transcriptional regulator with XRE-family HTH domain